MSLNRPVYVPPHKRKRFHGAFTGGYSAGYFNTVGSKDGWKPRDDTSLKHGEQTAEDFMDDQDFNEWGGPQSVKKEYVTNYEDKGKNETSHPVDLTQIPSNVGTRLLRVLGWREGSTAYVPCHPDQPEKSADAGEDDTLEIVLSKKRIRRIKLSQKVVKIPPPKHDFGGLGFDLYRDAPEFQAHREKRRLDAHRRSRAAAHSSSSSNVYRLSSVVNDNSIPDDDVNDVHGIDHNADSYESMQDFIGTKTSAGFAIREDDDDVYDDTAMPNDPSLKLQIDKNAYETEIFEHQSDDDQSDQKPASLSGILSSWIGGDGKKSDLDESVGLTADGRRPISGFRLGSSITQTEMIRYPGPDIPYGFVLKMHIFEENENPATFQKASAEEAAERRKKQSFQNSADPMAGGAFSGLATAIKNRFTSASQESEEKGTLMPAGLHQPAGHKVIEQKNIETTKNPGEIKIERKFMLFYPDSLLCKRFGVKQPSHANLKQPDYTRQTAEDYFNKEIMKHAETAVKSRKKAETKSVKDIVTREAYQPEAKDMDQRPSFEVYKAIYEPNSESETEIEEPNSINKITEQHISHHSEPSHHPEPLLAVVPLKKTISATKESNDENSRSHRKEKKHSRKKHKRSKSSSRRRRKKYDSSSSPSESDSNASSSNKVERRRRRKEKRKKKSRKRKKSINDGGDVDDPSSEDECDERRRKEKEKREKRKRRRSAERQGK